MPLSTIAQGLTEGDYNVTMNGTVVAKAKLSIGYQWLRDTIDFGGYEGSHFIVVPSRKIRGSLYVI